MTSGQKPWRNYRLGTSDAVCTTASARHDPDALLRGSLFRFAAIASASTVSYNPDTARSRKPAARKPGHLSPPTEMAGAVAGDYPL